MQVENIFEQLNFNQALNNSTCHIFWKTLEGHYLGCNIVFAKLFDLSVCEDILDKTDFDLYSQTSANEIRKNDEAVIKSGKAITIEETWEFHNKVETFLSHKTPLLNNQGKIIGLFCISFEITQRKKETDIANKAKSEFLGILSHELRTPLNAILAMAQILRLENLSEQSQMCAETIFQAGNNLLYLIDDILAYSKLQAGKLSVVVNSFDMRELVDEITNIFAYHAREKKIELIIDYAPDVYQVFTGDSRRIRQIIINLLSNAIKFTMQGYVILRVKTHLVTESEACISVAVIDTGIGIAEDQFNYIFERFTQINSSYNRAYQGTGLGLSIAKHLVNLMGGSIHVASKLGRGSTFSFTINLPVQQATLEVSPWEPYKATTRVMLVDDNSLRSEGFAKSVAPFQNNLLPADKAIAALKEAVYNNEPYQIVVVDQKLDHLNALEIGKTIKADPDLKNCLLLLLVDVGREPSRINLKESGFAAIIYKPLSSASFLDELSRNWQTHLKETYSHSDVSHNIRTRILFVEDNLL